MTTSTAIDSVALKIKGRAEMERTLESAVNALLPRARELEQGMLVTRIAWDEFIVSLTGEAAYGTIHEKTQCG